MDLELKDYIGLVRIALDVIKGIIYAVNKLRSRKSVRSGSDQ